VRMERAAEMLDARGPTVREVAHRVGYRQPAQFAKAFRRHHGVSPSAYRSRASYAAPAGDVAQREAA
jgi:AraC family transcriptional regulator of adaptative response / methylphosphotriester-DNA alkyltransferase methyltransferase